MLSLFIIFAIYRVKISKEDIKVIIFPGEKTKVKAFKNSKFVALIDKPICVTIGDCENFKELPADSA